jgi:hypothetical protein
MITYSTPVVAFNIPTFTTAPKWYRDNTGTAGTFGRLFKVRGYAITIILYYAITMHILCYMLLLSMLFLSYVNALVYTARVY